MFMKDFPPLKKKNENFKESFLTCFTFFPLYLNDFQEL